MSDKPYPRWQYALINGQVESRIIRTPEQEMPAIWKESPADVGKPEPEPESDPETEQEPAQPPAEPTDAGGPANPPKPKAARAKRGQAAKTE